MHLHGESGDGSNCWNTKRCDDRRYSYRAAPKRNAVRKQRRRQQGLTQTVEPTERIALLVGESQPSHSRSKRTQAVTVPLLEVATPHAYLYYFRRSKDAPVHALMAQLWVGDHMRARACFHVTGGGAVQIKETLRHVLQEFSDIAGVRVPYFRDEVELMPDLCPLRPCPLHPDL